MYKKEEWARTDNRNAASERYPVAAAVHGLGRGLSFGLSDYLLRTGYSEEELRKIEEHNELAAKGAQFASYLVPSKAIAKAALSLGKLGMPGRVAVVLCEYVVGQV